MKELNTIELPPFVMADLYTRSLVLPLLEKDIPLKQEGPMTPGPKRETAPGSIRSLGNNQQKILLLVSYPDAVFLPDRELGFLTGVLTACKLSMADVALVNLHTLETGYRELTESFSSRICILFGMGPAAIGLPMNFPHYQLQAFAGTTFLYAPSLEELEDDKVEKSKLWVCLKRLFNL